MTTGFVQRFKGKVATFWGGVYQNGVASSAVFHNAGAPTGGTSGTLAGIAGKGALLLDTTNGALYQNTNTLASPTWTLIEAAAGTLPNTATGALGTGTATFGLNGNLSKQLSVAGAGNGADTTEDTLFTYSLPANSLANVGEEIDIEAWGSVAATSATKTVKLYFGASITQSIPYTITQTGNWRIYARIFKQAANVQLGIIDYDALGATTTRSLGNVTNGAETDTAPITIKVTGQSSVATANLVLCNGMVVSGAN